jgi:glycosyltransferase involved in cell wall biosynthesis
MHVLFVHRNYPAQFGHVARYLAQHFSCRCTILSEHEAGTSGGVQRIQYHARGGATTATHPLSRAFENYVWHSHAVYEALQEHRDIRPDLVVGHSGFGSTLFLPSFLECPVVNYCEWFYGRGGDALGFRPEFPVNESIVLKQVTGNAPLLADLQGCSHAYTPTRWQHSRFPLEFQGKIEAIFDGVATDVWRPLQPSEIGVRSIAGRDIPTDTRIVTYVSRGFESMRGFDIFIKVAKLVSQAHRNVLFVCVGSDRCCYGNDAAYTGGKTFRQFVLDQERVDLDRFIFTGLVPPEELVRILNLSDLHIYLTVPFVLSWSMINALACGCTVLGSDTEPVREMITHGVNGLLAPFYDVESLAAQAVEVLDDPPSYRHLGEAGMRMIHEQYSVPVVIPKMLDLYRRVLSAAGCHGERLTCNTPRARGEGWDSSHAS